MNDNCGRHAHTQTYQKGRHGNGGKVGWAEERRETPRKDEEHETKKRAKHYNEKNGKQAKVGEGEASGRRG